MSGFIGNLITIKFLKAQYQSPRGPLRSKPQMIVPPMNLGVREAIIHIHIRKVRLGRVLAQTHTVC